MEKHDECFDATDLATFMGEIARRVWLVRETLWGFNKTWREGESEESAELVEQLSAELSSLGRQIKLVRNQLCQKCALKKVKKTIQFSFED